MAECQFPRESKAAGTVLISRRASLTSQRIILGCLVVSALINLVLFIMLT